MKLLSYGSWIFLLLLCVGVLYFRVIFLLGTTSGSSGEIAPFASGKAFIFIGATLIFFFSNDFSLLLFLFVLILLILIDSYLKYFFRPFAPAELLLDDVWSDSSYYCWSDGWSWYLSCLWSVINYSLYLFVDLGCLFRE